MSMLASPYIAHDPASESAVSGRLEWNAVEEFIHEVARDQDQKHFKRSLVEWQLAKRQFRKVDLQRMVLRDPDEADLRFHGICLRSLLVMGEALELWARDLDAAALADIQITHADLEASVEDLKIDLRGWHHSIPPEEVKRLQDIIFGATT